MTMEDTSNPQYITNKTGGLYEHDDPTREEGAEPALQVLIYIIKKCHTFY